MLLAICVAANASSAFPALNGRQAGGGEATLFSDGDLSLGISHSHVVADGQALWNFMISWNDCTRELPLSLPPLLDREILAMPNPSQEKATWKFNTTLREKDMLDVGANSSQDPNPELSTMETPPCLAQCLLILPFSAVKQLKLEDGGVHTSYEVICAHIWKHVCIARQWPSHEPTYFFVLANCRSRLKPPLPSSYFGNTIWCDISTTTIDKIWSESLHDIASRIRSHELGGALWQRPQK
ncbi:hypothetical protein L7F22_050743 [Adiantum nelumboides]|nr:hypothetical protein [Adiantum nelumboides]